MLFLRRATLVASILCAGAVAGAQGSIPDRISDSEYWAMVTNMSERGGFFRSDNFVSNEVTFLHPVPRLVSIVGTGGVYVGVGPEQNFSYIVALRPRIAFVVDIRRQNLIQHLMYKALIETATDRADFLSKLFSRARPAGVDTVTSANVLATAFDGAMPDSMLFKRNFEALKHRLMVEHRFALGDTDIASLEYVYTSFFVAGPQITYSTGSQQRRFGNRFMPTFSSLMWVTDSAGMQRGWLATEANFRVLRDLEQRNLIVPLVGDFGGPKALREVGNWLRAHDAAVSVFYTSNVEQYLFQDEPVWRAFYANVESMPATPNAVFIRALFNFGRFTMQPPDSTGAIQLVNAPRSVSVLTPIADILKAVKEGRIKSYWELSNFQ